MRLLWRRVIRRFGIRRLGAAGLAITASAMVSWAALSGTSHGTSHTSELSPDLLVDRPWYDRIPANQESQLMIFTFSRTGIGVYNEGSAWRGRYDVFQFSRSESRLRIVFQQDRARHETAFTITSCQNGPFDLQLRLAESPRGPRTYYGSSEQSLGDDSASARSLPVPLRFPPSLRAE